ncbi:MAG: hypothetical protein KKF41_01070 [Actinobacteria bacterium]|nr:hypothetical protein [Actinomycetota bacterium]MBU1943699.1 hypothetical protein [Actinomycetota bacterium]MBU2686157.1 hypothetical protein [Actinomycetota bacterium]
MAKKKKKKKPAGAKKSTYAKGKKVEPEKAASGRGAVRQAGAAQGKGPQGAAGTATGKTGKAGATAGKEGAPAGGSWNVVKRGTREMKVFQVLLGILIIGALLQYPLWIEVANKQYKTNIKEYEKDQKQYKEDLEEYNKDPKTYDKQLEEFQQKYTTPEQQKEHAAEKPPVKPAKPVKPIKPSFSVFLLYQALILVIQGGFFAFLGINVAARTDLATPVLNRLVEREASWSDATDMLMWSVPFGLLSLAPLIVSTIIARSFGLAKVTGGTGEALWKNSLNYINIALFNEMMFVFLLLGALVWIFTRYREAVKLEPHWAGLAAASLLAFGYFYLGTRQAGETLALSLSSAAFLAVSLVTVLGYLYWKKGFEYSLLAGVISLGVYPFIASVFIK